MLVEPSGLSLFSLLLHILRMAGINYRHSLPIEGVGVVPLERCSSLLTLDNAQMRFGIVLA